MCGEIWSQNQNNEGQDVGHEENYAWKDKRISGEREIEDGQSLKEAN